jgi:hypothetical protein
MGMTLCTSANPSAPTEVASDLQRPGRPGPLALRYASGRRPPGSWPSARGWAAAVAATTSSTGRWRATR